MGGIERGIERVRLLGLGKRFFFKDIFRCINDFIVCKKEYIFLRRRGRVFLKYIYM